MLTSNENFYIPSVNEQVNKLLQSYALKIHLIAELLFKNYESFAKIRKKVFNFSLNQVLIEDISNSSDPNQWKEFYKDYEDKKNNIRQKVDQLLVNMRDSRIGVPILTQISKTIFKSEYAIRRYLSLYIIEDVYNKWSQDKKNNVPAELFKRYTEHVKNDNEHEFEELATRLLNKMFFSSILVGKISEELQYKIFDIDEDELKNFVEFKNFFSYPQNFIIYMEETARHSSNPISFHVAIKRPEGIDIQKTPFRTHLLVNNFIINSCNNNNFNIFIFNTNAELAKKIESTIKMKNSNLLKKVFKL